MAAELICIVWNELSVIVGCTKVKQLLYSFWWAIFTLLHWDLPSVHLKVIDMYDLLRVECSLAQFHKERVQDHFQYVTFT